MWPSTAHLRPVLSVTIGAITTVVFWPCATSRIRSWGGSQCADLDAEADGGVDLGTLVRLGVGFRQSSTCTDYCRYAPMILCCCTRPGGKRAVSRCVNTEQGPELVIAVCGEDPETTAPTDAAPRVPWPRSRRLVERMHRPGRWIDRDHARRIRSTQRGHMSCHHHLGGVTLYWPDDPAGSDSSHAVVAQWKPPVAYGSPAMAAFLGEALFRARLRGGCPRTRRRPGRALRSGLSLGRTSARTGRRRRGGRPHRPPAPLR